MAHQETNPDDAVKLTKRNYIAIITISVPGKLNALTQPCFFRIATLLNDIALDDAITVTVITGTGHFFSAGADVSQRRVGNDDNMNQEELRSQLTKNFLANNFHNTHAWYSHPKILVTAMNGPAIGISAANIAHSDFIYAAPHAYLLTPFSSLGLVAEGASSKALVDRLGLPKANQALLMSRKIEMDDLLKTGFVNNVFDDGGGDRKTGKGIDSEKFLERVLAEIDDKLGTHLNHYSLLRIKGMLRKPNMAAMDQAGVTEVVGGLDVLSKGVPQREFQRIASGEKRHKL